jgi:hypothetical protein
MVDDGQILDLGLALRLAMASTTKTTSGREG